MGRRNRALSPTPLVIRVRRIPVGEWVQARFLAIRAGSLCVDDGGGPLWLPFETAFIHPDDWPGLQDKKRRVIGR